MTLFAARSELPFMHIVLGVTVQTPLPDFGYRLSGRRLLCVAGVTPDTCVSSGKRKASLFVVIEVPRFPMTRVVATLTTRPQLGLMRIGFRVASDAITCRITETFACMTVLAPDRFVPSRQWKARLVMVKIRNLPTFVHVTLIALLPLRPFVLVIFLVAGIASTTQALESLRATLMAI